jgi:hypothetical protein
LLSERHSLFHPLTSIATHIENGPNIIDTGRGFGYLISARS